MSSDQHTWLDFGWWTQTDGPPRLLSWNAATKELTFWPLGHQEPPAVLAVIPDEDEVRRRLEGWETYHTTKEGLAWLARQLNGCR